jgi:nucleotide-binding universal stress UspA family protein
MDSQGSTEVRRIVVGVDGSETSRHALRWAAEEARSHGSQLHVVHAWEVRAPAVPVGVGAGRRAAQTEGQHDEASKLVADVVREELGEAPPGDVRTSIGRGAAAGVLLDAARDADLLVVGSRGIGGFRGLLLGSVSSKMAAHAPCPVVIVRPAAPQDD